MKKSAASQKGVQNVGRLPARALALSYLLVIMTMSIIFSFVFYSTSVHELDKRPLPDTSNATPRDSDRQLDEWIGRRSADGKVSLGLHLITLNVGTLLLGSGLSYWLARRTLRPIEKSLNEQDQFIADASHELRTPITTALLSNEIALKNTHLTLEDARAVLEGNVQDMQELKRLSDELLYESGETQREVVLRKVDILDGISKATEQVRGIAQEKQTPIINNASAYMVQTDSKRFTKILVILIENAIKYSPSKSEVTITSKLNTSSFDVIVTDHGIGIDKSELRAIFDRFYRVDHARSEITGYGLGLSIAKKLSKEIRATLLVESVVGSGSSFTVRLPLTILNRA